MAEKRIYRRSEIQALLACRAFENQPSEAASFGSLFHAIAAEWAKRGVADVSAEQNPFATAAVAFEEVALKQSWGVAPERMEEMRDLVLRFVETHDLSPETFEGVELTLMHDIGSCIVQGTVDRLDRVGVNAVLINDWKTAWSKGDDTWQLRFYGCLLCYIRPHLEEVYARADYVRLADGVVEYHWTRDELRTWWTTYLLPAVRAIGEGPVGPTAEPTGGAACQYCRNRWSCPMAIAPYRNEPRTDDERIAMVGELVRLEAAASERRQALNAVYKEREPEVVNDLAVGWMPPKEETFRITNLPGAMALLQTAYGPEALTIDLRKLAKPVKKVLVWHGVAEWVPPELAEREFRMRKAL